MAKTQKTLTDRVDDFIGVFSPQAAAKRRYFRYIEQKMLGSYRGAEGGRLRGSWIPGGGSADQDLLRELPDLRERSRDLVRNDGIASGAIDTIITNIIGSGIKYQSRLDKDALKVDEEYTDKLQRQFERVWNEWCNEADAGNRMNFYEIEELSERQRFVNGESILIPVRKNDKFRRYSLALMMVESDRLKNPSGMSSDKTIREGVQLGEYGEPVNYFIRKTHPGDIQYGSRFYSGESEFIKYPARNEFGDPNILHLYHVKRPGQSRGEPFFAPVLNLFKDRMEYMEAELVAARVAACFAIFVKKDQSGTWATGRSSTENDIRVEEVSPAMVEYLNPGESIETFNPNRPGGTFGMFMERVLRDISSGLNMPYEILAKDFSRSNYSNTRAALLEARRFFMMQQQFLAQKMAQPILSMLLEEAYLRGELPILDFYENRSAYCKARWIAPGWKWVDPQKEVDAATGSIEGNLSNLAEECGTQGQDWEENLEQRARELKKIKDLEEAYGVKMTKSEGGSNGKDNQSPGSGKNDGEDEEKAPPASDQSQQ